MSAPGVKVAARWGRWAAALVAVFLVAGCSDVFTPAFEYGEVEVQTERRTGDAVPGVELVLYTGTRHLGLATTGPDGSHRFDFVPAGQMAVSATLGPELRALDGERDRFTVTSFRMEEGERRTVRFTLLRVGPGSVAVRAVDGEGDPVSGVTVELYDPFGVVERGRTGDDGVRAFQDVPYGEYGVRALPGRGYVLPGGEAFADGLLVDEGYTARAELALERCLGRIRVRAVTEGGASVSGVPVSLYDSAGVRRRERTGVAGLRLFTRVPCGDYGVRAGVPTGYRLVDPADGIVDGLLVAHEEERVAELVYAHCRGTLEVRVVDDEGRPVEDAGVELYGAEGVVLRAVTGADGAHDFTGVACGPAYGVRVLPPPGFEVEPGAGTSYVDGIGLEDDETERVTFTLTRSDAGGTAPAGPRPRH